MSTSPSSMRDRRGRVYTPAIGPRLKQLLWLVLGGFALLGANGVYLASITIIATNSSTGCSLSTPTSWARELAKYTTLRARKRRKQAAATATKEK